MVQHDRPCIACSDPRRPRPGRHRPVIPCTATDAAPAAEEDDRRSPQAPCRVHQARRPVALLDEIYDRICAPDVLFEIWIPTQWALVRWMVGRCTQRWDKTLPVTARITGPLVDGEMVVDLPLAKNYSELVYPNTSVENCFDHICQLVVLQVLTATLRRQLVTVEVTVNSQTVNLTEAVQLPGQPAGVSRQSLRSPTRCASGRLAPRSATTA